MLYGLKGNKNVIKHLLLMNKTKQELIDLLDLTKCEVEFVNIYNTL